MKIYWFTYFKSVEANMLLQVRLNPAAKIVSQMTLDSSVSLPCLPISHAVPSASPIALRNSLATYKLL
jgi:hypothetical protein